MKAQVISNTEEAPGFHTIHIQTEEEIMYEAGQFMTFKFTEEGKTVMRPYTIMTAPWEHKLIFCVRRAEHVSNKVCDLKAGEDVEVNKPMGTFILPKEEQDSYLLICNGIGITHMRALLRTLFEHHYSGQGKDTERKVTLLYGARNQEWAVFDNEMKELAQAKKNFRYLLSFSRAEGTLTGYVQEHLDKVVAQGQTAFLCGSTAMVKEVERRLKEQGINKVLTEFRGSAT